MKQMGVMLVGLTGGIGSGKSTVAGMLSELGLPVVDADEVSRGLTAPGGLAMPLIEQAFGAEMVASDGSLNRPRMREQIFAHPEDRLRLESILHPLVGRVMASAVAQHVQNCARCVILDVPLITAGSRWPSQLDRVLVVDCQESTQITRVGLRSQLSENEVSAIIRQQITRQERRRLADWVLFNEGLSLEALRQEVLALPLPWPQIGQR